MNSTKKLYVIGDSNSYFTSEYLLEKTMEVDVSCSMPSRKCAAILDCVNKRRIEHNFDDASAIFVFCGMNDSELTAAALANSICDVIRATGKEGIVRIYLALPFVPKTYKDSTRAQAAKLLSRRGEQVNDKRYGQISLDEKDKETLRRVTIIKQHISNEFYLRQKYSDGTAIHMNEAGYRYVAEVLNQDSRLWTSGRRISKQPKRFGHTPRGPKIGAKKGGSGRTSKYTRDSGRAVPSIRKRRGAGRPSKSGRANR